jgi:hypothetical protein
MSNYNKERRDNRADRAEYNNNSGSNYNNSCDEEYRNSRSYKRPLENDAPKLMSKVAAVMTHSDNIIPEDDRWNPDTEMENEKPAIRPVYQRPDSVQRNKRMFGNLMGHLGRARQILEKDSQVIEKQEHQKNVATLKNQAESQRLYKLHLSVTREEKDRVSYSIGILCTYVRCTNNIDVHTGNTPEGQGFDQQEKGRHCSQN